MDCWSILDAILPYSDRTLLYGPPGTGKTYIAQHTGKKNVQVFSTYITEYTPVTEPRGTIYPVVENGERVFKWFDGPATKAYREGGRLIINEIDKASDDCMTFFLALLDDRQVSRLTLPHGEVVEPHPDFSVVATMNARPNALLEALRDRFPVTVHVDKVNPKAVMSLDPDLRDAALKTSMVKEEERRHGIRKWLAFQELRKQVPVHTALEACFGADAKEMAVTFKMAEKAETERPVSVKGMKPGTRVDNLVAPVR